MATDLEKSGAAHFAENQKLFSSTQTEKEKFNLYGGLGNMARTIQQQGEQIARLEKQLAEVIKLLKQR